MTISVFTPSHDVRHIEQAYASLVAQTDPDWQWVLLLNNGAQCPPEFAEGDDRVHIVVDRGAESASVGLWKSRAVSYCTGELILELDHDDMLVPTCIAELRHAFALHPGAAMIYGNTVQVDEDRKPNHERYRDGMGWTYRDAEGAILFAEDDDPTLLGSSYTEIRAMAPTPHNVSLIWFAPNHPRAFTRAAYDAAGGYDEDRDVLDDQDLMGRLYRLGEFLHLDSPLYLQRVHANQTQRRDELNARIQTETWDLYERDLGPAALAWSARQGLHALDVGCGSACAAGFLGVDVTTGPGVRFIGALPDLSFLPDSSCGVIRLADVLEHVGDQLAVMAELHRVLAPGGLLLSLTPSTDGRGAFQDPTHVSFWNENSFWYWTDASYRVHSPQTGPSAAAAPFQVSRVRTYHPSDWHEQHKISYVQANLIAVKDEQQSRDGGELLVGPPTRIGV